MATCAVCGAVAEPPFRAPQPEGSPDLDGRPGEPTRSTLSRWVQTCRGCGASAPDVSVLPAEAAAVVKSAAYRALRSPFQRWAMLAAGTPEESAALLQAAWDAEDAGQDGSGLRRLAADTWPGGPDPDGQLRLADVQRRAGLQDAALATLNGLRQPLEDGIGRVAAFERRLVTAGDTGRHLLSSALRPPARTPHVAHGKPADGGFWARLMGRGR